MHVKPNIWSVFAGEQSFGDGSSCPVRSNVSTMVSHLRKCRNQPDEVTSWATGHYNAKYSCSRGATAAHPYECRRHQFHTHLPHTNQHKPLHFSPYNTSHQIFTLPSLDSPHNSYHLKSIHQVQPWLLAPQSHNHTLLILAPFLHNHLPALPQTSPYHAHPVACHHIPMALFYPGQSLGYSQPTSISTPSMHTLGGWPSLQVSQWVGLTTLKSDRLFALFPMGSTPMSKRIVKICFTCTSKHSLHASTEGGKGIQLYPSVRWLDRNKLTSPHCIQNYSTAQGMCMNLTLDLHLTTQVDLYCLGGWCTWWRENSWQSFGTFTLCDWGRTVWGSHVVAVCSDASGESRKAWRLLW